MIQFRVYKIPTRRITMTDTEVLLIEILVGVFVVLLLYWTDYEDE